MPRYQGIRGHGGSLRARRTIGGKGDSAAESARQGRSRDLIVEGRAGESVDGFRQRASVQIAAVSDCDLIIIRGQFGRRELLAGRLLGLIAAAQPIGKGDRRRR